MKIKLALLDRDMHYLSRITAVFTNRFSDKLEVYSFTDEQIALEKLQASKIHVFLASDAFHIDTALLPKHCGFAYFVESANIETYKDMPAICKYQKVETIYKMVLEIFSETVSTSIGIKYNADSHVRVVTFVSASGGVGSSTAAVACAKSFAANGQKTLYLNLEQFGNTRLFLSGEGQTSFSDVLFALKSNKTNLSLKLESNVRQDSSGVYFYESPEKALDMLELKTEEIQKLINGLMLAGFYENIVFDIDFSFHASTMEIFKQSSSIVFVSDGSEISNDKFLRVHQAIEILDEHAGEHLLPRVVLFYNKFSSKTGRALADVAHSIGGAPKYDHATTEQIVSQLVGLGVFQKFEENNFA